jgi:hypothetical protein
LDTSDQLVLEDGLLSQSILSFHDVVVLLESSEVHDLSAFFADVDPEV